MNSRRLFWLAFLGGAVVLAVVPEVFFPEQPEPVAMAIADPQPSRGSLAELRSAAPVRTELQPASPVTIAHSDLFSPHSWYVAPPAPPLPTFQPDIAVPPPAPVAPPLPFRFIGKLEDQHQVQIFLLKGEQLYTVQVGDVIDDTYRVDEVEQASMRLTYLPLRISQSLAVGSRP